MKRKTIRNNNEIVASINDIAEMIPALRETEIIGYSFNDMANDLNEGLIDDEVWNILAKKDFHDKEKKLAYSETRGVAVEDEAYNKIIKSYMARDEVKRAPFAYVTKLVLFYVREKLYKQNDVINDTNSQMEKHEVVKEKTKVSKPNLDEDSKLIRLNSYLNLLIHTDPDSLDKIRKIDEVLKEDNNHDT